VHQAQNRRTKQGTSFDTKDSWPQKKRRATDHEDELKLIKQILGLSHSELRTDNYFKMSAAIRYLGEMEWRQPQEEQESAETTEFVETCNMACVHMETAMTLMEQEIDRTPIADPVNQYRLNQLVKCQYIQLRTLLR
jgi:hypothetical protein